MKRRKLAPKAAAAAEAIIEASNAIPALEVDQLRDALVFVRCMERDLVKRLLADHASEIARIGPSLFERLGVRS